MGQTTEKIIEYACGFFFLLRKVVDRHVLADEYHDKIQQINENGEKELMSFNLYITRLENERMEKS